MCLAAPRVRCGFDIVNVECVNNPPRDAKDKAKKSHRNSLSGEDWVGEYSVGECSIDAAAAEMIQSISRSQCISGKPWTTETRAALFFLDCNRTALRAIVVYQAMVALMHMVTNKQSSSLTQQPRTSKQLPCNTTQYLLHPTAEKSQPRSNGTNILA